LQDNRRLIHLPGRTYQRRLLTLLPRMTIAVRIRSLSLSVCVCLFVNVCVVTFTLLSLRLMALRRGSSVARNRSEFQESAAAWNNIPARAPGQ
jgi:hypothetical protein